MQLPHSLLMGLEQEKERKAGSSWKESWARLYFSCCSATAYKISHFSSICKWKYRNKVSKIKNVNMQGNYTKAQTSIQKQIYQLSLTFTLNIIFLHSMAVSVLHWKSGQSDTCTHTHTKDVFAAYAVFLLIIWKLIMKAKATGNTHPQQPSNYGNLRSCVRYS